MNIAEQLVGAGYDPSKPQSRTKQHEAVINSALPNKAPDAQLTVTLTNNQAWDQYFSVMNDDMNNAYWPGQLNYTTFTTLKADGVTVVPCTFNSIGVFATGFTVAVQHPAGIGGFRDFFKENHLLAPAFAYNVGVVGNIPQFSAPFYSVSLDKTLSIQTNTPLNNAITKAQTGNTLTNFAIIVNNPVALTRCSDIVLVVKAGMSLVLTFQSYLKNTTK